MGDPNAESIADSIEKRVALSLAVGSYLRTAERFNEASSDFTAACKTLRKQLKGKDRFVVQVGFNHYLVTSDHDGNFDVDEIEFVQNAPQANQF